MNYYSHSNMLSGYQNQSKVKKYTSIILWTHLTVVVAIYLVVGTKFYKQHPWPNSTYTQGCCGPPAVPRPTVARSVVATAGASRGLGIRLIGAAHTPKHEPKRHAAAAVMRVSVSRSTKGHAAHSHHARARPSRAKVAAPATRSGGRVHLAAAGARRR